jgi:hypothetical protein
MAVLQNLQHNAFGTVGRRRGGDKRLVARELGRERVIELVRSCRCASVMVGRGRGTTIVADMQERGEKNGSKEAKRWAKEKERKAERFPYDRALNVTL